MNFIHLLHQRCSLLKSLAEGLLVFEKGEEVLSHPNSEKDFSKSLFNAPYDSDNECYLFGKDKLYLLHRLDSPTSGIILASSNKSLADIIKKTFESRDVEKCYYAWVKGIPVQRQGVWRDKISKTSSPAGIKMVASSHGVLAETYFQVMERKILKNTMISLLKLMPHTGRTHQLRIQCQLHHCPILGDQTYGNFEINKVLPYKRLFLHAEWISLQYKFEGKERKYLFESKRPSTFMFL